MINKSEIEKKLPYGAKKAIANNLGLTEKTVSNILKGKTGRMDNCIKVIREAKRLIKEYEDQIAY
ncbi:hypothetical protein ACR79B_15760 [Sphingobacterium spiritivorum]|uniref:hypothetical protein n=1 Tax=Sphingobacterium spiritivorum TaxID=258 RepID=UPI003DA1E046